MPTIRKNKPVRLPAEAEFYGPLTRTDLCDVEAAWCPTRARIRRELITRDVPEERWPQHLHWNWGILAQDLLLPGRHCESLRCDNEYQGIALAIVDPVGNGVRMPAAANRKLVYLDYIESAPWNLKTPVNEVPLFSCVGARLVQQLVRISQSSGFEGRLGLHSLEQSEEKYAKWGMECLLHDPGYNDMAYFEFAPAAAAAFAAGECQ